MIYLAILSANQEPYQTEARTLIDLYRSVTDSRVVTVFEYVGGADGVYMENNTLHLPCDDTDTIDKQEMMYRWFLDMEDARWLIKTNTVTVVNLHKIIHELPQMRQDIIHCGFPLYITLDDVRYEYPMGNFNMIHRSTVENIVDIMNKIHHILPGFRFPRVTTDDVHLGAVARFAGIHTGILRSYSMQKRLRMMMASDSADRLTKDVYSAYVKIQPDTEGPNGEWGLCNDPDAIQDIRMWYEPEIIRMLFDLFYSLKPTS